MKCEQQGCDTDATTTVFWPGKETNQCDTHAQKAVGLGRFMGFDVPTRPIEPEETDCDPQMADHETTYLRIAHAKGDSLTVTADGSFLCDQQRYADATETEEESGDGE